MTQQHTLIPSDRRAWASVDGPYRYLLGRSGWGGTGGRVLFVMLNPSTADAHQDDPTIRKCIGFARAWRFSEIEVVNLFAFRATNPKALTTVTDPVGPRNDAFIREACGRAELIVAAWGRSFPHSLKGRVDAVAAMLAPHEPHCLGVTLGGQPRHPLFLPYTTPLVPFSPWGERAAGAHTDASPSSVPAARVGEAQ